MAAGARPIAGGTDLVVGARHGKAPLPESLVGHPPDPRARRRSPEAGTGCSGSARSSRTLSILGVRPRSPPRPTGLLDASAIVGSHATRANGTLGGNVMNASPAMDTGAPLLCHGRGRRTHRAGAAPAGSGSTSSGPAPGRTSAVARRAAGGRSSCRRPPAGSGSAYVRLQYRRQMEIAVVGAAAYVELGDDGTIATARVAITALTPVIRRVPGRRGGPRGQRLDANCMPGGPEAADLGQTASGADLDAALEAAGTAAGAAATPDLRRPGVGVLPHARWPPS